MSAPDCWACSVSSRQSLADVAAVQAWMTTSGLVGARLLDRHLQQPLAFVERQRPELGETAGAPEHRMAEVGDAVAHQRAVGVPVDVVAVAPAERRIERVTDPAKRTRAPTRLASPAVAMMSPFRSVAAKAPSGEVGAAVDVDVGPGHVGVAPGCQERDDGPDLLGQPGPRQVGGMPEVLVDGVHEP